MSILELILALLFAAALVLVWTTLKAREAANHAIRQACERAGFLFLDDTVALHSMWPARSEAGHVTFRRVYRFAYSDTGHDRRQGSVSLLASVVTAVDLGHAPPGEPGITQRPCQERSDV